MLKSSGNESSKEVVCGKSKGPGLEQSTLGVASGYPEGRCDRYMRAVSFWLLVDIKFAQYPMAG